MADPLIAFEWYVPAQGFEWADARPTNQRGRSALGRFLTPAWTNAWPGVVRVTRTFHEYPQLFGPFANVPPTEEGVLAFANTHGALVLDEVITRRRRGSPGRRAYAAESLDLWKDEITAMRHASHVLGAVQSGRTTQLRKWFPRRPKEGTAYDNLCYEPDEPWPIGVAQPMVQYLDEPAATAMRLVPVGGQVGGDPTAIDMPVDPRDRAMAWLRSVVNARLGSHTRVALLYTQDTSPRSVGLSMVPKNLLGAVWLQFARAVEGKDRFQRCPVCNTWFRLATTAKATTTFCSAACRVRDLRHRKDTAVRLRKRQVPVATIATRVRSSPDTVKKWVREAKRRERR